MAPRLSILLASVLAHELVDVVDGACFTQLKLMQTCGNTLQTTSFADGECKLMDNTYKINGSSAWFRAAAGSCIGAGALAA